MGERSSPTKLASGKLRSGVEERMGTGPEGKRAKNPYNGENPRTRLWYKGQGKQDFFLQLIGDPGAGVGGLVNLAPQRWRGAGVRISTTATGRDAQPHRSRSLTYREPHARTASAKFGIHGRNGTERAASICGEMRGMTVSSPSAQPFCSSSSAPSGSTPPPINDKNLS
ncbi:hypothetical protein BDA96_10G120600 [Sorghum bicolor]|uniref:Uncharacterized protein n=2 Tax=Sorghum bicolor TaxID=4558 RepID=A0A921Q3R2_SORBI|nr:hypothetical protein BDA96_10G120600 [Sorghum bicolor]OQU76137.1 hypothetical protein SORBI_3010G098932 [Sorghum bicolor]